MTTTTGENSARADVRVLGKLLRAEWAAGILGLRLFMGCVTIAAFMLGAVWVLGGGLSTILAKGGTTFLGGDVAITTNVPLAADTENQLTSLGTLSKAVELRSTGNVGDARTAIELKAVDSIYPLYGSVELVSGKSIEAAFAQNGAHPPAIVEPALLTRTGGTVGDVIRIGGQPFIISDALALEPDRLSAGRFMVGPRVIVPLDDVLGSPLVQRGAIVEYRYRVRAEELSADELITAVEALRPPSGWEFETPKDAGDRVLRTVERTTSFLGVAGIVALTIGLSGAWAAAKTWLQRRGRTIALYRLSGATPGIVFALHAIILALASLFGLALGLGAGFAVALPILDIITERLHVPLLAGDILVQVFSVSAILTIGLIGTGLLALSGVSRIAPGSAMRSGEAPLHMTPKHVLVASGIILSAVIGAALSLPVAEIAGIATFGFLIVISILAAVATVISRFIAGRPPRGFFSTVMHQSLGNPGQMATRTVALGIGIIGITSIVAAQNSLNQALTSELPTRVPDLVLIDIQPAQVDDIRARIDASSELDGLQADPFMRMTITAINGVTAQDALVREDKSWVIEGDRSFSWTAEPTGAELLQGEWWANDYAGPTLVSPEEDMMEAFDLKVGDIITYSVLGRTFESEVANIRKEYHRTFRPEYLMMASPQPFKSAPHTWIMSLQGQSDAAIDDLIISLAGDYPNVTSIDIRTIVSQVKGVIDGATLASVMIAVLLVAAGALSVSALVASDVDARRREALVFSLIGASRREVASARLMEAAGVGLIAAIIGGTAGVVGGYFVVTEGLRIPWAPSITVFLMPIILGVAAAVVAGVVGGLGAAPKGRGQLVRLLTE